MIQIRASAIHDFLDCPARAEARHLQNRHMPGSVKALLGKAIHASTAAYDQGRIDNSGITIDEAAGAAVDEIHKPTEEILWEEGDKPQVIESIALNLHKRYCSTISPKQDYVAVEVRCDRLEISDLDLALTGTTDRVRKVDEGFGVTDLKTGGTAVAADGTVSTKGHAYQLGVYELLAEHGAGLSITAPAEVVGMQTGKTEKGQRVATALVRDARLALVGDEDSPGVLEAVSAMIKSGAFVGNPRSMLCSVKFCPIYQTCRFRR